MKQGKTLEQLGAELQRQRILRADFIADTRQLQFKTDNNESRITFENGGKILDFGINPLAHQQIASRLGIPLKYYQRMQAEAPALLDENVNNWLEQNPARRMLRIMDGNVRAFLSDRYRRLDNLELCAAVLPIIHEMKDFASRNNIIIISEYVDRAKSAVTDDRPEFQKMIKDSSKKEFDIVLVHKLDRFARNRGDSIVNRSKLKKNGVSLLSVTEPLDDEKPESIILEAVLEAMAEYYSKNLAREVRKGMKENALKAKHTGGKPPLGYDIDPNTRELVINETEAEAVKLIFSMVIEGKGYGAIVRTCLVSSQ